MWPQNPRDIFPTLQHASPHPTPPPVHVTSRSLLRSLLSIREAGSNYGQSVMPAKDDISHMWVSGARASCVCFKAKTAEP